MPDAYDFTYLSLGAGVQSSALYVASVLGLHGVPRADVAVFADTQDEPAWVYTFLEVLKAWGAKQEHPIRVDTVTIGCLSEHIRERHLQTRSRFACIPAWVRGKDGRAAPLRRQCIHHPIDADGRWRWIEDCGDPACGFCRCVRKLKMQWGGGPDTPSPSAT